MIYILHGDDIKASYTRLSNLMNLYSKYQKVNLSADKTTLEEFHLALFSNDLFEDKKLIICENFFKNKLITQVDLKGISKDKIVIFWEKSQLTNSYQAKISSTAKVEGFKLQPIIFHFLDSLAPKSKKPLDILSRHKLAEDENSSLIWHLANRLLLLILSKRGVNYQLARQLSSQNFYDWQWSKIVTQAKQFNLKTLYKLYSGALKIDSMIKTGATDIKKSTLVSLLLVKYLQDS